MEMNIPVTRQGLLDQARKAVNLEHMTKLVDGIIDMVLEKNKDYGDAWQRYGIFTPLIRINDKILRVKTLAGGQQAMVADEKVEDNLKDTIGYALLALLKLEYKGDISITDAVDMCKKIADAHIEDVAKAFGAPPEHFKDLPNCPFEVRIMEKDCEENDDEKVSMYFPVTIGDDGKYEAKAEDLMNAAIDMFNGNLCVKWDGLLPKGWHSVEDSK
jgi:hypothetical protein